MSDAPNGNAYWRIPKPSINQMLAGALALSLAFSGYLVLRPDVRTLVFSPTVEEGGIPSSDPTDQQYGITSLQTPAAGNLTPITSPDINTLIAQMQNMQNMLQATTSQLEQKSQAASVSPSGIATKTPLAGEDIQALWAEIERLNQVMQPLMIQLEITTSNRSSRSASELAALRTQVNTIHQRLSFLLARVETAKNQASVPSSSTTSSVKASQLDQATYARVYQTMTELQSLLNQMQSQGNFPWFHR